MQKLLIAEHRFLPCTLLLRFPARGRYFTRHIKLIKYSSTTTGVNGEKLYVFGLLLLLLLAHCAQQKPYTEIQQPISQTEQRIQYLAEVIKMNSDAIDQQEKQFSGDLQMLNSKLDQIIVLQSKVSNLEVKVNTIESKN